MQNRVAVKALTLVCSESPHTGLSSSQPGTQLSVLPRQPSPLRDSGWQDALCFCLRHAMAVCHSQFLSQQFFLPRPITAWLRSQQRPDRAVSADRAGERSSRETCL
ncbi:hypothetical protein PBY51_008888 [Eleginops maclovinus]|uniref:Uncharacterized protein n=1 Tax=Eleginops maclovinus TaxID=56733 RepID=A0AAN7WUY8_ELEMC|nr:hypothetical protein PBY51_008888 [Eleginops maclovinus]